MTFDVYNVLNILRTDHSIWVQAENPVHSPDGESLACGLHDLHGGGLISSRHGGDDDGPPVCPHSCGIGGRLENDHCHRLAWIWTFLSHQTYLAFDDAHFLGENPSWSWTWNLYLY